jgi:hypothetical protein
MALGCSAWLWSIQFNYAVTGNDTKFGAYKTYGEHCSYATIPETSLKHDSDVFGAPLNYVSAKVPLRVPGGKPIVVPEGNALIVRCKVNLTSVKTQPEPWITVGLVTGTSTTFLNQNPAYYGIPSSNISLFLRPQDITESTDVTLVIHRQNSSSSIGLLGSVPLMFGSGKENLNQILAYWKAYANDNAYLRIGLLSAISFFFVSLWLKGIRYPDINWIIAACGSLVLFPLTQIFSGLGINLSFRGLYTGIYFSEAVTVAGVVVSFLRRDQFTRIYRRSSIAFVSVGFVAFSVVESLCTLWPLTNFKLSMVWLLGWLLASTHQSIKQITFLPDKRAFRVYLIATFSLIGVIAYSIQLYYLFDRVIVIAPFVHYGFIVMLSSFVVSDLVTQQHEIVFERQLRRLKEEKLSAFTKDLSKARMVQSALFPEKKTQKHNCYEIEFLYQPENEVAGDWALIERYLNGHVIMTGDISVKGPSAAIAMASVVSILKSNLSLGLTLDDLIERLDSELFKLYQGSIGTTLSIAFLNPNARISLASFGAPQSVAIIEGKANLLESSGGFLGMNSTLKTIWNTIELKDEDGLAILSDGYIESSRDLAKWAFLLEERGSLKTEKQLMQTITVYAEGKASRHRDDKSGVLIRVNSKSERTTYDHAG